MLPKFAENEIPALPTVKKTDVRTGADLSLRGALPRSTAEDVTLYVPRTLAVGAAVLRIRRDNGVPGEEALDASPRDLPFDFVGTDGVTDIYTLRLDLSALCGGRPSALFYYEYIFPRGLDTLFSDTCDNVTMTLRRSGGRRFRLLIYEDGAEAGVPSGMGGGIMYHVFVDRFSRGSGPVRYREDAVLHEDWDGEEPDYAPIRGGSVANNDFFGGNLWGVAEKLPYLRSLGVTVLYLSPIFDSPSNHKYDTSDYERVDPGFGGDAALEHLLEAAHGEGMRVVLDGVFNHVGSDSVYFDEYGRFGLPAADEASPRHDWFFFRDDDYGIGYECWWGIRILPKLNLRARSCHDFLVGPGGVADKYTRMGVDGWRLDVADELPDAFLDELRVRVKSTRPDAFIVGEVWENAADKVAYGHRRSYFRGHQLDSVMNYPLRSALLAYGAFGDAEKLGHTLLELWSSYPPAVCGVLMNVIGTHDTERILSMLGDPEGAGSAAFSSDNEMLSRRRLTPVQREEGKKRLRLVSALQYTVFGFPCVYYGDECGMEGMGDPFCRRPMPWGREDPELLEHYRRLGRLRRSCPALDNGDFRLIRAADGVVEFLREGGGQRLRVAANQSGTTVTVTFDGTAADLYGGGTYTGQAGIAPGEFMILQEK